MASTINLEVIHLTEGQAQMYVSANQALDALDGAVAALLDVPVTADVVLTDAQALRNLAFNFSGAAGANRDVTVPDNTRFYFCRNATSGGFTITVKTAAGTGIGLTTASWVLLYCDGVNVVGVASGAAGGVSDSLNSLTDVTITSVATGQMIRKTAGDWVNEDVPYDVGGGANGVPTASSTLLRFIFVRSVTIPASATASVAELITGPSAQTDFDLRKNGSSFGTMRFATSGTTATWVGISATTFAPGDVLTVVCPANLNGASDLTFTLAGRRN